LIGALVIALFLNLIPDYFSLIFSRMLISVALGATKGFHLATILILDVLGTFLIFFLSLFSLFLLLMLFVFFLVLQLGLEFPDFKEVYGEFVSWMEAFLEGLTFNSSGGGGAGVEVGVYLYSTFVTSIWLWIHIGVLSVLSILRKFDWIWAKIVQKPKLSKEPPYFLKLGVQIVLTTYRVKVHRSKILRSCHVILNTV